VRWNANCVTRKIIEWNEMERVNQKPDYKYTLRRKLRERKKRSKGKKALVQSKGGSIHILHSSKSKRTKEQNTEYPEAR
jgi:hypothetical protein